MNTRLGKCFNKECKAVGSRGNVVDNYKENGYGAWFCFKCFPSALKEKQSRRPTPRFHKKFRKTEF